MTLKEHIDHMGETPLSVGPLPSGKAETIKEFFETFVQDKLPHPDVVRAWHKALMEYTDDRNLDTLSCCVRFGNNGGKKTSKWGERGYYKLRRGWLTKNRSDDFAYFFADNFFSSFIYRMALDKVAPVDAAELRELFNARQFPYGFGFFVDKTHNEYRGVVIATSKNPGFLSNYKLSHVFDAGEFFDVAGKKQGDAQLSDIYYPIGHSDDFLSQPDRIRRDTISLNAKKVIVAKFLRFAHPFNYFLTPTKQHHVCGEYVYKRDIGEDPRMISYMRQYLKKTYPTEYDEFVKRILWYDDPRAVVATGDERIDITYGLEINAKGSPSGSAAAGGRSPSGGSDTRDRSHFQFDGGTYTKGRLVLAVVQKYVADHHPADFAALQHVFPDRLQGTYGVVRLPKNILPKYRSAGKDRRYYIKDNEVVRLDNGEEVLVSDQWSLEKITGFIQHVTDTLAYSIKTV